MPHSMERPCRRREPMSRISSTIILIVLNQSAKDYTRTLISRYQPLKIEIAFDSRREEIRENMRATPHA